MHKFVTILAGGGGTRFWPLSRQEMPKQLLNISGNDIMLNDTIGRFSGVIPLENTIVVTNSSQAVQLESIMHISVPASNILVEPIARNTAASILYAALFIDRKFGDSLMVVSPSDHHITDEVKYRKTLTEACAVAEETNKIVTIGIKPTFPSTGYGYISHSGDTYMTEPCNVYEAVEFVEKPSFLLAEEYLASGSYLWNSGIFIWKTSVIIDNFKRFLPRLYKTMLPLVEEINQDNREEIVRDIYPNLPNISIDYGILERSDEVVVISGDFGWNDIGSWDALGAIIPPDEFGNIVKSKHLGIQTRNSIIYGEERLITTIGIDGLIIADTKDALLICSKDRAQDVKDIVVLLKKNGMREYI
ncbi:mannose-1-phosphate guanylyltransferase [Cohnella lupini]|uniref:mannose-1-phosphate guanylyltransferase n=1 Tax=Cohnella lupini TaxID=1294267 RepID=A0A3D9IC11_9BACL|nr:mannose-1-phosphate guanylyltransferase [Cohnella lupini]RED59217.1 mannose-1-phosphate guanylyltransferase (GDP) /mannose-6-phosphate isomerase type 2 [Cohnella lupini]